MNFRRVAMVATAIGCVASATVGQTARWQLSGHGLWSDYSHEAASGHFEFVEILELSGGRGYDLWLERRFAPHVGVVVGWSELRLNAIETDFQNRPDFPDTTPVLHLLGRQEGRVSLGVPAAGVVFHLMPDRASDLYVAPHLGVATWRAKGVDVLPPEKGLALGMRVGCAWPLGVHWLLDVGGSYLHTTHEAQEHESFGDTTLYTLSAGAAWRF
jgi:hypothetical protein